jgi:hypothetical protein
MIFTGDRVAFPAFFTVNLKKNFEREKMNPNTHPKTPPKQTKKDTHKTIKIDRFL